MALQGHKVLCIDGDVGLRNLDITLGMTDAALMDFSDVIARPVSPGPGGGAPSLCFRAVSPHRAPDAAGGFPREVGFRDLLAQARQAYEYVLVDSPAGLGAGFRLAVCDADRAIVVAVSDPSSLRDAQRVVSQLPNLETIHLVVNRVRPRLLRRQGATIDDAMDTAACLSWGWCPRMPRWCWPPAADVPWPR